MSERKNLNHRGRTFRAEMDTSATPRQVYEAWTDPLKLSQWFNDRAAGEPVEGHTMTWYFDRFQYALPYLVLAAVPDRQFALEGRIPGREPGILEVTIEQEAGRTHVRLVNSGFLEGAQWDDEYEGVASGWQMMLAVLRYYLENYFDRPRREFFSMRPARFAHEQLMPYFLTPQGLSHWLAASAEITREGDRYRIDFRDGLTASGRILSVTRREVLLEWKEIDGVLALKAFGMGPAGRMICVQGLSWGPAGERVSAIEKNMAEALDRLAAVLETQPVSA